MTSLRPGCFGKIRAHGDFVRHNADAFTAVGLEPWLDQGLLDAQRVLRIGWDGVQKAIAPLRFLFQDGRAGIGLIGILVPSIDRVGRRFPLVLFAPVRPTGDAGSLCLAADQLFARCDELAGMASRGLELTAFRTHLDSLRGIAEPQDAARTLDAYSSELSLGDLAEVLAGGIAGLPQWLANVEAAFAAGPPEYALHATVRCSPAWIGAVLRVVQCFARGAVPRLVVFDRRSDAAVPGVLRLSFAPDLRSAFVPLAFPAVPTDRAYDLTPRTDAVMIPPRFTAWTSNRAATVMDLVRGLQ